MKSLGKIFCLAAASVLGIGCGSNTETAADALSDVRHLNAEEAAALISDGKADPVILDIRTPQEFAAGHLKGALNIDFNAADFRQNLEKLDRAKPYLIHCRSGGRSTRSLPVFAELGFQAVHHLDGGIQAWEAAGRPVEKP